MKLFLVTMAAFVMTFIGTSFASAYSGAGGAHFSQEYVYDFAKQGGAVGFISLKIPANALPQNAIVTSMHYMVQTAFTSGGSATVALGDAGSGTRFKSATAYNDSSYAAATPAAGSGAPYKVSSVNIANVGITVGTAALTGGKMVIVVQGYLPRE